MTAAASTGSFGRSTAAEPKSHMDYPHAYARAEEALSLEPFARVANDGEESLHEEVAMDEGW